MGMNVSKSITLAAGSEKVGLAVMLSDLIRQNLEQNPEKLRDFLGLDAAIAIRVPDAGVAITLAFKRGALVIHGGVHGAPRIHITTTAETLLSLAMLKIAGGLPNLFSPEGYGLVKSLLKGELSIRGIFRGPIQLVRFTRLMSVNK
jgi:hypothetical protein